MPQRNWQSVLADQLEGGVSTEKALLDIKRGVMLNLFHESIGLSASATPKYVSGIDTLTGTGVVAFDKIKYLPWRDYKPVAEGKESMVPHVGSVDTIQIPIDQMWYFATFKRDLIFLQYFDLWIRKDCTMNYNCSYCLMQYDTMFPLTNLNCNQCGNILNIKDQ